MKVILEIKKVEPAGGIYWEVSASTAAKSYGSRTLARLEHQGFGFPFPADGTGPFAAAKEVYDAYSGLTVRPPSDPKALAEYLFAVLIGVKCWNDIQADLPQGENVLEFVLRLDGEHELARLPWEMARHPGLKFLAAMSRPLVAFTREVANEAETLVSIAPRALFVIGTEPAKGRATIQPMTEIAGMLRRLDEVSVAMQTRLLLRPSLAELQDELARFDPSVVHFLCHGEFDSKGNASLLLADKDGKPQNYSADQLAPVLKTNPGGAPVVVMSACNSGGSTNARPVQESSPLAGELVKSGIPMALGMAGRVQDLACILFTRQFYATLLSGGDIPFATAAARFAGITQGTDPDRSIDWSMPTFFQRSRLSIRVDKDAMDAGSRRRKVASHILGDKRPRYFCGRYESCKAFQDFLDGRLPGNSNVLGIVGAYRKLSVPRPRYGMTRLLRELAAHVVLAGHLPCVVEIPKDDTCSNHWMLGAQLILTAINDSWNFVFDLASAEGQATWQDTKQVLGDALQLIERRMRGQTVDLPPLVGAATFRFPLPAGGDVMQVPAQVVSAAIRYNFARLLEDARDMLQNQSLKLVVFIDGVERLTGIELQFVQQWLSVYGLGETAKAPIPVVLTYAEKPQAFAGGHNPALREIGERFSPFNLDRLPAPTDDWMPYQQFLYSLDPPLMFTPGTKREGSFYARIERLVQGVPSRFELPKTSDWHDNNDVQTAIDDYSADEEAPLVRSKDEDARELMRQRWGL